MSDGMSDSRPHSTDHEKWDDVDGVKLKKPVDVYFFHFRDGVQAECLHLGIEFFVSRWGTVLLENALNDGGAAISFTGQDSEEIARKAMKDFMKKKLKQKAYQKYLKEEGPT